MMSQPENFPLAEISFLLFFLIPMSIIAMQYIKMGIKISKQTTRLGKGVNGSVHRGSSRKSSSHRAVIRMLGKYETKLISVLINRFFNHCSCRCNRIFHLLGAISRSAFASNLRTRLYILSRIKRMDVLYHRNILLLFLHSQSYSL